MIYNKYRYHFDQPIVYCDIYGRQDGIKRTTYFSAEDEKTVRKHIWNYANGYAMCTCHGTLMHRLIMQPEDGQEVDHIDRARNNNMRSNLRVVLHRQNLRNQGKHRNNTQLGVPIKGVYWAGSAWTTEITKNGVQFKKGGFETLPEAIVWKIRREYELFGVHSPNYRPVLKKMPRRLLHLYLPEIYGNRNTEFIGTPIYNAHYKNKNIGNPYANCLAVRKAGTDM